MVNEYVVNYTARGNSELCLVATLQRYLNIAKINQNSEEFIFRSITSRKNHQHRTLRKKNVPLSCTNAKELFLAVVTEKLSLHSLRSGGASAAANAAVNDRLFKRDGCWVISRILALSTKTMPLLLIHVG